MWLAALFPTDPVDDFQVRAVLREHLGDPRAAFIVGSAEHAVNLLERAAAAGYAPAQAMLVKYANAYSAEERRAWAERAAAQNDREGLFELSRLLMASLYPADRRRGEKLLVESAQLGSVSAMMERALCVGSEDPERYRWWGRVTARGEHCAVANLCRAVERMNRRPRGPVMYAIGSAWEGHLNVESCSAFGATMSSDTIQSLVGAVKYFVACNRKARAAIRCWIVIARRHGVVKDMRTTIARMVWKDRAAWSKRTI